MGTETKDQLRQKVTNCRKAEPEKAEKSERIIARLLALPQFAACKTAALYVNTKHEVHTRPYLRYLHESGKRIALPAICSDSLLLVFFKDYSDLELSPYKVWQPRPELLSEPERRCGMEELDLIVVPGVAFDRQGGRLGRGKGCYDRLLALAANRVPLIALAFDCQMVEQVPMEAHDIRVDLIVTETGLYDCRAARADLNS